MPKNITVLRVFVASPSDVTEERSLLETIVGELNRTWSNTLGVMLDLIKWETHVLPGFNTDPQAVINEQVPADYDIFIAIFWGRVGTPTPRAASGTLEEFERAFARFSETQSPQMLVYFKDAPLAPSKVDPTQLTALLAFKASLSDRGGLYSTFDDLPSFESSLRAHLSAVAQKHHSQPGPAAPVPAPTPALVQAVAIGEEEDDYGYLDYLEISETKQQEMTEAMQVLNEATERVGQQMAQRNEEIGNGGPPDHQSARRIIRRTAEDLTDYADTVRRQVAIMSNARVAAYGALSKTLALQSDLDDNQEQLQTLRDSLAAVLQGATDAQNGMRTMKDSTAGLPRISKELNKAKRAVVTQLDAFSAEIDSTKLTVSNIIEAIDRMLDEKGD